MSKSPNGYVCLFCGKPLVGKQRKYCSDKHRQAHIRAIKKGQSTEEVNGNTENVSTNSIAIFESMKHTVARQEGQISTLEIERDRLLQERDKAQEENIELREKLVRSEERINQLEGEEEKPSQTNNRPIWIVSTLILILIIIVIYVITQGI